MLRYDLQQIYNMIHSGSKVLDLGCGDGILLKELIDKKNCIGYGIEIDTFKVINSMRKNINVIQDNLEKGLNMFESDSFDFIILSQTIQSILKIEEILIEMIRVSSDVIVTFPNFGFWKNRIQVFFKGYMPKSCDMPYDWYNTPNIHWCTLKDFDLLCNKNEITIMEKLVITNSKKIKVLTNLLGSLALYRLSRKLD